MLAAYASAISPEDPLAGLTIGERPEPEPPSGWVTVNVRAASLNHHDLWSLRGVGLPAERLPMILGCDAAGVDPDGNEVLVHAVIGSRGWSGDETLDPKRTLLSEVHQGTLAEQVMVPRAEPRAQAARAELRAGRVPADRLADRLPHAVHARWADARPDGARAGLERRRRHRPDQARLERRLRVWTTGRTEEKRALAVSLGADAAFEPGARLPERVDAVMETVGAATWSHSVKSLKQGGVIVISGATTGDAPPAGAHPHLLPAALGRRLDDGHARRARAADAADGAAPDRAGDQPDAAAVRRARRLRGDARGSDLRQDRLHRLGRFVPLRKVNVRSVEVNESVEVAGFWHDETWLQDRLAAKPIGASVYRAQAGRPIRP